MTKSIKIYEDTYEKIAAELRPRESFPQCLARLLTEREAWRIRYENLIKDLKEREIKA